MDTPKGGVDMEEDTKGTCSYCSDEFDLDDLHRDSAGDYGCSDCVGTCDSCSTVEARDDMHYTDRDLVLCDNCAICCDRCSDYTHRDDSYTVNDDRSTYCLGCYENNTWYCEGCEVTYDDGYDYSYVQGSSYCDSCYSSECYYCDDCDESFRDADPCECRNDSGSRPCRCRGKVHDYNCKPPLVFIGDSPKQLYMGFELECQIGNYFSESVDYASQALAGIAQLKSDSSIGADGFEIVTQPHTHAHYRDKSQALWQVIDNLRTDFKARSWDTDTCGLHIHISRTGFSSGAHMHRFIALVYHNSEQMMKLAGRKTRFARFNDVYTFDEYDRPVLSLKHKVGDPQRHSTERYSAVNTQNKNTLELRFFRGTMQPSGVLSALDLAHAMVEYTRDLRVSDVRMGALTWDWFTDYVRDNNGMYPDLYSRLGKLGSVNINKHEMIGG